MTILDKINGRKIGILGMARSGLAAARLAAKFGGQPFVSDNNSEEKLKNEVERLKSSNIPYETSGHTDLLLSMDYLVVSPGVPLDIPILKQASEKGIPIFSEIEFAYWACKGKIIAITGSNGKTTTTTLLGEIFLKAGFDSFVGGNIGMPFSEIVFKIPDNGVAILEVSNFQMETIADFKPDIAILLNLTPDHLDRHGTFENYVKAKLRITENQNDNDLLILNMDDKGTNNFDIKTNAERKYFSITESEKAEVFVKNGILYGTYKDEIKQIIAVDEIGIKGPHNLQNASAAVIASIRFGIEPDIIATVLKKFHGVEHRLENVGKVAGITFINDSKATNLDSVGYALRSIKTPLYLIAGGKDKGGDFRSIIELGKGKIKTIIAIGNAREKIFDQLGSDFPVQFARNMKDAVELGFELALPGETVMLSPGCASFDMFDNFEHRGREFKKAVKGLKNGKDASETLPQK